MNRQHQRGSRGHRRGHTPQVLEKLLAARVRQGHARRNELIDPAGGLLRPRTHGGTARAGVLRVRREKRGRGTGGVSEGTSDGVALNEARAESPATTAVENSHTKVPQKDPGKERKRCLVVE